MCSIRQRQQKRVFCFVATRTTGDFAASGVGYILFFLLPSVQVWLHWGAGARPTTPNRPFCDRVDFLFSVVVGGSWPTQPVSGGFARHNFYFYFHSFFRPAVAARRLAQKLGRFGCLWGPQHQPRRLMDLPSCFFSLRRSAR
nr:hypothetical protein [Pandoravirus belohorizontensis]